MNVGSPTTKAAVRCAGVLALALLLSGARANVAHAGGDSGGGSSYGASDLESCPTNAPNRFEHGEHGGRGDQGDNDQGENGDHGDHGKHHHGGGGGGNPGHNPGGGGGGPTGGGGGPTGGGGGGPTQPVPEPSTMALAGMGLMAVAGAFRRRFGRS